MAKKSDDDDETPPEWGTIAGMQKILARQAAAIPDLRVNSRIRGDFIWPACLAECEKLHGRRPSIELHDQPDEGAAVLLRQALEEESVYIQAAMSPATPADVVAAAERSFFTAVRRWIVYVTGSWCSAAEYQRQQAAQRENW